MRDSPFTLRSHNPARLAFVREQLSAPFHLGTALEKRKKKKENSMRKFVFRRAAEEITHQPDGRSTSDTPLWAKAFGIITILVMLPILYMLLMDMMMGVDGGRSLPLWVLVSGFSTLVVVLLFFIAMLAGVGGHGRDRQQSTPSRRPALLMPPPLRKLVLTAHIAASVGWAGGLAAFLALAIVELSSQNALMIRGTFLSMEVVAWVIVIPLSLASLFTGLVQAFFSKWGLLRHYWILAKFVVNIIASITALMYIWSLGPLAEIAAASTASNAQLLSLKDPELMTHPAVALLALLVATILSVYKARGMTRYGQRKQDGRLQALGVEREDRQAQAVTAN